MKQLFIPCLVVIVLTFAGCSSQLDLKLSNGEISLEIDSNLFTKIVSKNLQVPYSDNSFRPSEFIIVNNDTLKEFKLISSKIKEKNNKKTLNSVGLFNNNEYNIEKSVRYSIDEDYPNIVTVKVSYKNLGADELYISEWINNNICLSLKTPKEILWSFQGASYPTRPDWVLEVADTFSQENYMGMNASDYGGGIPVVDVWTKEFGIGIGHLASVPKLVSLPVTRKNQNINISIADNKKFTLKSNDSFETLETFLSFHKSDYFETLASFSNMMKDRGIKFKDIDDSAYEPIWCAWGYERNFNVKEVLNTLPKVKELGLKWAVLDDGWQTAEGDWYLNPKKFPNGDRDMKAFVDKIHSYDLKAKLWWAPLAVDPKTDLIKKSPELLLINKDGKYQDISWWDSYYLCPAYEGTINYTEKLVEKIIKDWGYDGLKIDGQHMNAAPPCYNPLHHHKYPEESVEAMPAFYNSIYETVMKIKKDAVVEICPCGDAYSFYMLTNINQPVSSDPTSSWQIRTKGKTIKAIMGSSAPFYGDHVELSSTGEDFASSVGIGAVVGTKFTWPAGIHINTESGDVSLTPEREKKWKKWIGIYNDLMLPKGEYLGNLYDIGFDKPETHVVKKDSNFYYAFFDKDFNGTIELRGLETNKNYNVYDYVNDKDLGKVNGSDPFMHFEFNDNLLIKVSTQN